MRRTTTLVRLLIGTVAVLALLAGGCGDDDATGGSQTDAVVDDAVGDEANADGSTEVEVEVEVALTRDGGDAEHGDHDHGEEMSDAHVDDVLDVRALHEVDEQLADGRLDAAAQRTVVADYVAVVEAMEPTAGSTEADLLMALQDLDAALEAGDLATAAGLAAAAHDLAHDLGHGHG